MGAAHVSGMRQACRLLTCDISRSCIETGTAWPGNARTSRCRIWRAEVWELDWETLNDHNAPERDLGMQTAAVIMRNTRRIRATCEENPG